MPKYTSYTATARKKKVPKKRTIILIVSGVIALSGLLVLLDRTGVINLPFVPDKKSAPMSTPTSDGINYGPPTEQEVNETEDFKKDLGDEPTSPRSTPSTSTTKKTVTPIMTSWAATPNVEVRGFVPGITEEDGTCTLTLTKGDQKVTESKAATPDATTVSCGLITIARDRLSAGTWSATLSYSSASSEGVSTSNSVEVE